MANVLVTGATGLLGTALVLMLRERGHRVTRLGYTHATDLNANLSLYGETADALNQTMPDVIVNLAAITDVDRCEKHPHEAYLGNVKPVENLCAWIRSAGEPRHLVHISSDHLYDGPGPHVETKITIRNHYAMSKLAGEFAAGSVPSTILRTNFVGRSLSEGRRSFTDWLYGGLCGTTPINVFDDVMFSPLSIGTLCDCIARCIINRPLGIFNVGSRDGMSKADFAFAFAGAIGLRTTNLRRVSTRSEAAVVAPRPTDMRMNCERFEVRMGLKLPLLTDELRRLARDYE